MQKLGNDEDLRWAEEYVSKNIGSGRVVYACLRPSEEQAKNSGLAAFGFLLLPCLWFHAAICSPCIIYGCLSTRKKTRHLVYIITNREVLQVLKDYSQPG
jgi:hypothetical protein